ncbi:PEP-CTERM sorting domain-containing protein [Sedimenticola hydrogenitrophicus]|uniref:PEP-CTERM sorting domain-containing protein n=1 Tax=Sedimenticola hydrogenitrophicus TaxID=2967975 RepID=UPI0021A2E760|nr:PEP-CTERM sorting domain-containing protein [Sedimenticola hydrogenitrophicus]
MNKTFRKTLACAAIAASLGTAAITAEASHFRGGAMIPTIENGILTVVQTTFWRKNTVESNTPTVTGVGGMTFQSAVTDTSDSRYDKQTTVYTVDISNVTQGVLNITAGSCCRVATAGSLANWIESSWDLNSSINWDGNDAAPINFDFGTIQPEVSRLAGNDYSQGLNATSPDALALSYNQDLNLNINSQVPGFTVNTTTGQMTIIGDANRAQITDNTSLGGQNVGADAAFSGNIIASDGSMVEFDWMFDGVDAAANQAPMVDDMVINALVGPGPILHTFTATDPEDGALLGPPGTWDPVLVLGAGFINALPTFNTATQLLSWDTTGYAPGQYLIQARAFDSASVGDFGLLTINLCNSLSDPLCSQTPPPPPGVPIPGTLFLLGIGLAGLGWRFNQRGRD